jgi:hypothetical protein
MRAFMEDAQDARRKKDVDATEGSSGRREW